MQPTQLDKQYSHCCMLLGDQFLRFLGSPDVSNILGKVNEIEQTRRSELEATNLGVKGVIGPTK